MERNYLVKTVENLKLQYNYKFSQKFRCEIKYEKVKTKTIQLKKDINLKIFLK